MKTLIVYDSVFGNTEKIARAIGDMIAGEVKVVRPREVNFADLSSVDLLIVGSPTQGGRPIKPIKEFLENIPVNALKNVSVASFDTRDKSMLVKFLGYAAGRIGDSLKKKGGIQLAPPEGFYVISKSPEGPLEDGELERAADWAKAILASKD